VIMLIKHGENVNKLRAQNSELAGVFALSLKSSVNFAISARLSFCLISVSHHVSARFPRKLPVLCSESDFISYIQRTGQN